MIEKIFGLIYINSYYIIVMFSIIIPIFMLMHFQKISKIEKIYLLSAYSFSIMGLLLGAKILFIMENYLTSCEKLYGGYSYMGAIIGYLLFLKFYTFFYKMTPCRVYNLLKMQVFEIYGISKIGCYFSNCCIGIFDVPLQLIESILYLLVFYTTTKLYKKIKCKDNGICIGFIIFGILRFIIDFARINRKIIFYYITLPQIICVCLLIVNFFKIIYNKNNLPIII